MGDDGRDEPRSSSGTARDAAEIRSRIAVCFSMLELRRLAEDLGVPDIPWDAGMTVAARDLVRHFERQGQLWTLVDKLREVRPLLEWPDPGTLPPGSFGQPPASAVGPAPPAAASRTVADPDAAPAPPRTPVVGGFPGNLEPEPLPPPHRVDPRLVLLVAAGAVLVALGIAFAAGRATKPAASAAGAGDAPSSTGAGVGASVGAGDRAPAGPARLAAAAIGRRIEAVARICQIAPGPADEVMRRAFERCGPAPDATAPAQRRPTDRARPLRQGVPAPRSRPAPASPRPPVVAGNAGCLGACEQRHRACKVSQCGSEPTQGSQYKRYQDCLSTCLKQASQCRLGCP